MTAAEPSEFKLRHREPATRERVAAWLRLRLQAQREGKCDAVVTYYLERGSGSRAFDRARELFHLAARCAP